MFAESALSAAAVPEFLVRFAGSMDGAPVAGLDAGAGLELLEDVMAQVGTGGTPGVDHPVAAVLVLCAVAVVAGIRSIRAIAEHVGDTPAHLVSMLYRRCGVQGRRPPSKSTIWRAVTGADPVAVDVAFGAWLGRRHLGHAGPDVADDPRPRTPPLISVDGKTVRGARTDAAQAPHLLAAAVAGVVLAQAEIGVKSNEIPGFAPLLDQIDIAGHVVVADALHTQRQHATYLHGRDADFVFTVKGNQPNLYAALDGLNWSGPWQHQSLDRGHGRIEQRLTMLLPAPPNLPFPHVEQVWLQERKVTGLGGEPLSHLGVLGVTSLDADHADAAAIAAAVRGEWGIEVLHWKRDVVFGEDASKVRTRSGPRIMASLRNLAIGALHQAGRDDTAAATRWAARRPERPFTILRLTS